MCIKIIFSVIDRNVTLVDQKSTSRIGMQDFLFVHVRSNTYSCSLMIIQTVWFATLSCTHHNMWQQLCDVLLIYILSQNGSLKGLSAPGCPKPECRPCMYFIRDFERENGIHYLIFRCLHVFRTYPLTCSHVSRSHVKDCCNTFFLPAQLWNR